MKQLLILLCLVVLPTGIRAQEDHDIAASLNLNEVVVLADGMTFEEYLKNKSDDFASFLGRNYAKSEKSIIFVAK